MKNILLTCLAAVLLFSASAAISLYLQTPGPKGGERDKEAPRAEEKRAEKVPRANEEPATPIVQQPAGSSSEQATRLLTRLNDREQGLKKREEDLRKQEQRMEIVLEDVRGERAVLDGLRKEFGEEMKRLTEKQDTVARKARGLEEQKEAATKLLSEMRGRQIELEKSESGNLNRMASISDVMPPEKAAAILKQLAESGQTETAVKLLGQMKERRAAQVLAEMTDVTLAAQLLDKLRGLKKPGGGMP